MDREVVGGFICSKHTFFYQKQCTTCAFEKYMSLSVLLDTIKPGQVAKATYARTETWYFTLTSAGQIRYCNEDGTEVEDLVPLTFSNRKATYEIVKADILPEDECIG